jgi:hypothetical protein
MTEAPANEQIPVKVIRRKVVKKKHQEPSTIQKTENESDESPPPLVVQKFSQQPSQVQQEAQSLKSKRLADNHVKMSELNNIFTYVENQEYSPMKNNIIDQCTRIKDCIVNPTLLHQNYNHLINGIISSLNTMIETYNIKSKKAIESEIYTRAIKSINFDDLKSRLITDLKTPHPLKIDASDTKKSFMKIPKLQPYESSYIESLYIDLDDLDSDNSGSEVPISATKLKKSQKAQKKFRNVQKLALSELNNVIESLTSYENSLCKFREKMISKLNTIVHNVLYPIHANYAKQLKNKILNADTSEFHQVGNIKLKLYKSQMEFIKESVKSLLQL